MCMHTMQLQEPATVLPAAIYPQAPAVQTPLLYPFPPRRSRHAYASIASLKAAARAALSTHSHFSMEAHASHLWPLAQELLQAGSLQNALEASRAHASSESPGQVESSVSPDAADACMHLGTKLPNQSELMGVAIEGGEHEPDIGYDACIEDEEDSDDSAALGPPVATCATHALLATENMSVATLTHARDSNQAKAGAGTRNDSEGGGQLSQSLGGGLKSTGCPEDVLEVVSSEGHRVMEEEGTQSGFSVSTES